MSQSVSEISRISPERLKQHLDAGEGVFVLDLRQNRDETQLPASFWFDATDILKADRILLSARKDQLIVTYCDTPNEEVSAQVAEKLRSQGYWNAHPLEGGIDAWKRDGFPVEPRPKETLVGTE